MNDPFYATLKLVTGEEVLAEAIPCNENGVDFYILNGAIVVEENVTVDNDRGVAKTGLTPKKWPLFGPDDLTIVYKDKVVTITELDEYAQKFYEKALLTAKASNPVERKMDTKKHPGYLGSTQDIRKYLDRLFNDDY